MIRTIAAWADRMILYLELCSGGTGDKIDPETAGDQTVQWSNYVTNSA